MIRNDLEFSILDLFEDFRIGTVTIDGIYTTKNIPIIAGGYTEIIFGMISDHRLLWFHADLSSLFDHNLIPRWKPATRRLKLENPAIVSQLYVQDINTRCNSM
jgi:hypothetical protein